MSVIYFPLCFNFCWHLCTHFIFRRQFNFSYRNSNLDVRTREYQIWKFCASDQQSRRPSSRFRLAKPVYGNYLQRTCDYPEDSTTLFGRGSQTGKIFSKIFGVSVAQLSVRTAYDHCPDGAQFYQARRSFELVSISIGYILLTKSLLCNVATFTGTPYISESSYIQSLFLWCGNSCFMTSCKGHKLHEGYFSVQGSMTSHIALEWGCAYMYKCTLYDTTHFKVVMVMNLSEHPS
jgi:hypothetical protein